MQAPRTHARTLGSPMLRRCGATASTCTPAAALARARRWRRGGIDLVSECRVQGGRLAKYTHASTSTHTDMTFSVYIPSTVTARNKANGVVYYLSGLTCTDDNVAQKGGFQEHAERHGLVFVAPDTSPRGAGVAGEDADWDFGTGAGFYVDATAKKYAKNYNMYSYVTGELPALVETQIPGAGVGVRAITGHSMGGHGALVAALREAPGTYSSVSAFAPICHPSVVPWGQKAFKGYLKGGVDEGAAYDATELLLKHGARPDLPILIDCGADDPFLKQQLAINDIAKACRRRGQDAAIHMRKGYDHSYFFVSTFMKDHLDFHAKHLKAQRRRIVVQGARVAKDKSKKTAKKQRATSTAPATGEFAATTGKVITCKAAVAYAPNEPLQTVNIQVDPPKAGEVRVKVMANALCHTDVYTLTGQDPEGLFPCILGHEAGAVVESVGPGVTSVKPGDHVIPCYTPECGKPDCIFCQSKKTNLCPTIRATQGKGVMPDGTSRFRDEKGNTLYHFMGCSTFSEYSVLAEISCAKISKRIDFERASLFGCGISTGLGAVWNTVKVEPNSSVAVWGLGAVGLAVVQAAQMAGAKRIFAIDLNEGKYAMAKKLGATDCLNPSKFDKPMNEVLVGKTKWGVDYTFDCTGNVKVMRTALEAAHRGWGQSCVIGVASAGQELATRPFQLVTGRRWCGTAFGGWKSRTDVPKLINRTLKGELPVDAYITHRFNGVDKVNDAIDALHEGDCLRAVVSYF